MPKHWTACSCPDCLAGTHPPVEEGEPRTWVLHDACAIRSEAEALALIAQLEAIDEHETFMRALAD